MLSVVLAEHVSLMGPQTCNTVTSARQIVEQPLGAVGFGALSWSSSKGGRHGGPQSARDHPRPTWLGTARGLLDPWNGSCVMCAKYSSSLLLHDDLAAVDRWPWWVLAIVALVAWSLTPQRCHSIHR